MSPLTIILSFYIPLFLLTMVYVVVNGFHFIRFRLPGDLSWLFMSIYLLAVASVIITSISSAIVAYTV
ncbi:MAG: hypothetical protein WC553_03350 [Patescibacteria group bacterium]|jgi:hypothetical protein